MTVCNITIVHPAGGAGLRTFSRLEINVHVGVVICVFRNPGFKTPMFVTANCI